MAKKERSYQSGIDFPEIPIDDHVECWVRWALFSEGTVDKAGTIPSDAEEVESLRKYTEACIGVPISANNIVKAVNSIVFSGNKQK